MASEEGGHSWPRFAVYVGVLIVAGVLIFSFAAGGITPFQVSQHSMLPTFEPGDFVFALAKKQYHRGDIVILRDPTGEGKYLVKRIAGLPGDRISIDGGCLFINGQYASEPYIFEPMNYTIDELTVPDGDVFVLGDNRNESEDSSLWRVDEATGETTLVDSRDPSGGQPGVWKRTVPLASIVGRVSYRYLPFNRMGSIASFPLTNVDGE